MINYLSEFRIVGEIADSLHLKHPENKLLVDISTDLPGHEENAFRKYPNRTTLTILDNEIIQRVAGVFAVGDVIEATGSFQQSDYIPYRTTSIDTTFLVNDIKRLRKTADKTPIRRSGRSPDPQMASNRVH